MNRLTEGINVYQVNIIRLKDKNADSLISGLEKKQKQGEPLRKEDLVPLLLTPLMSGRLNIGDRIIRSIAGGKDEIRAVAGGRNRSTDAGTIRMPDTGM